MVSARSKFDSWRVLFLYGVARVNDLVSVRRLDSYISFEVDKIVCNSSIICFSRSESSEAFAFRCMLRAKDIGWLGWSEKVWEVGKLEGPD